ncbi:Gfo/Idh/MocA family oxidoreductase [Kribbella sandramycini]|uniref:Gfo/Idh/MocA family oxidoreductase n=1 Tax=Kribbella sandramycini TaxID=60450 RepID=A0A7Y4KX04_9ACTN|nr:Gfo/Idh/MocA family oxidoreductase [Kribbella sandramycini]MBB6569947.1 putative dehydrogenase [Kribbella sandramycini]NOL40229.1 Gfo/Idh/MocA family oxidoreductase [Kribbella sandramycini]
MPNPLKIATLSFWHVHAGDYSRQAQEHPGTELVAVWDDDEARGKAGAESFGVEYTSDLDALLASDVDGVVITTGTDVHRDIMVKAARAGKHIFTEKVLAPTVAEAEEIIAATDDNGVKLTVSLPRLAHGYTQAIREVLDSGRLGQVTYARVRLSHDGAIARDGNAEGWLPQRFFDERAAIGGALTDLGCHPVYLTQLFLGAEAETVSATYRSIAGRGLEDNAVVVVGYPNQTIGVIEAGFASPNPFTIEIFGTDGTLTYSDAGNVLKVGDEELPVPGHSLDPFGQWVEHIVNGTRADENISRALELTRLVVAANEAATTNQVVAYNR